MNDDESALETPKGGAHVRCTEKQETFGTGCCTFPVSHPFPRLHPDVVSPDLIHFGVLPLRRTFLSGITFKKHYVYHSAACLYV